MRLVVVGWYLLVVFASKTRLREAATSWVISFLLEVAEVPSSSSAIASVLAAVSLLLSFLVSSACFACRFGVCVLGMGVARENFVSMALSWVSVAFMSWKLGVFVGFVVSCVCSVVILLSCFINFVVVLFSVVGVGASNGWAVTINLQKLT